jgi:hypothetical protein
MTKLKNCLIVRWNLIFFLNSQQNQKFQILAAKFANLRLKRTFGYMNNQWCLLCCQIMGNSEIFSVFCWFWLQVYNF